MSIKMITLAAVTVASTASIASANTFFNVSSTLENRSTLDLGLVDASGNGQVAIYDYRFGTQGELLGVEDVHPGANIDVSVDVGIEPDHDVLAVLMVGGQEVASKRYFIEDND